VDGARDLPARASSRKKGRGRRRDGAGASRTVPTFVCATLLGLLVVGAPLALGAVHRIAVLVVLAIAALLALSTAWLAGRSRSELGSTLAVALPLFFVVVAAVQMVPIPAGLRAFLDPKGSALLSLAGLHGAQPLSLDPPETYGEFAKAAAALCVALAALAVASGRRLRFVVPGLIASAGLAAIAIGLGHRAAAEDKVFGHFFTSGGLLVGPFINPNHTAEFLEIAAFAALAFSFARTTAYGQRVWKLIAAVLAAGAISTLSRGSVLALGSGALVWFVLAPASDQGEPLHRSRFVGMLLALVVVVGIAIGLGGDKIVDEFRGTASDNLSKLLVAKDALSLVLAHPAGIGLSAFSRVYPVYKTLHWPVWLQFVENQPVSILVETGIAGAVLLLAILALVGRRFWQEARRDRVEASLLAGLVAVIAHNVFDFGLETLGILLPFSALLGTAFGRQSSSPVLSSPPPSPTLSSPPQSPTFQSPRPATSSSRESPLPALRGEGQGEGRRLPQLLSILASAAALFSIYLLSTPSTRDFDALLRSPLSAADARSLAHAASLAHPTDYAYALAEARLTPAATHARLRLLNRAMILCPLCVGAHQEAARDLWRLGRHSQSLLEWKTVITESRPNLYAALDELSKAGAKPEELATLADDENRFDVSRYLLGKGALDVAKSVLAQASNQESAELYLVQAEIALAAKDIPAAQKASQRALELAPRNPRCALLVADIALLRPEGASEAMAIVEKALHVSPADVSLNRKHLSLLMQTEKWQAIDQALAGLRAALAESGAPSTEANIDAAQIFEKRGQFRRAISEYQAALAHIPDHIGLRLALARDAEQIGGIASAVDAYSDVLRRDPANAEAKAALARIQHDKKDLEVDSILRATRGAENK
jgi:tetratricopeptide (TPR) repeat protein/O-antigen ligase